MGPLLLRSHLWATANPQKPFPKGVPVTIDFSLAAAGSVSVEHDTPVTIVADKDWIPLPVELDMPAGSAWISRPWACRKPPPASTAG